MATKKESVELQANGLQKGESVYAGTVTQFATKGTIEVNGVVVELQFKNLREKLLSQYTWNTDIEGYSFVTYVGGKGDNFTDIHVDGKLYISHLSYQSVKRIAEAKNWSVSKLHRQYLTAVGRVTETTRTKHTSGTI